MVALIGLRSRTAPIFASYASRQPDQRRAKLAPRGDLVTWSSDLSCFREAGSRQREAQGARLQLKKPASEGLASTLAKVVQQPANEVMPRTKRLKQDQSGSRAAASSVSSSALWSWPADDHIASGFDSKMHHPPRDPTPGADEDAACGFVLDFEIVV